MLCRAKNIQNKPHINEDPKDAMLREFQKEIEDLKRQLEDGSHGEEEEEEEGGGGEGQKKRQRHKKQRSGRSDVVLKACEVISPVCRQWWYVARCCSQSQSSTGEGEGPTAEQDRSG